MDERERRMQTARSSFSNNRHRDWRDLDNEELKLPSGGQSTSSSQSYTDPTEQWFLRYPVHPAHRD
jgi:hypothetical protein